MELKNNIYIVSLTHWDREWRFPFEKTRMLLVEMLDSVLDLLDNDPEYKCFHLDGQTILLEDYCEVRPENYEKICDYVKQGRLMIGPWLLLPEENQMSGESLVRNFLWGEKLGRKYGGNMKVGYSPTSWGQVSQMPQIMSGFDVDSIIFYRGISPDQSPGNFYIWEGPDGSKIMGIRLGDFARVGFFHLVDRAVGFNRFWGDETHDWNLGGKPYRLCGSGSATPYEFHQPPNYWYPENLERGLKILEDEDLGEWITPWALSCECDDCTGPFILTPKVIKEANKLITNDKEIKQGTLPEFVAMAREHLNEDELTVLHGEMRSSQKAGKWTDIYAEIHSCRIPTKYLNRRVEFALQRTAEPLGTIAWMLGQEYPEFSLDRANYTLLQNHAHDSIGGCGRDAVDEDVQYRLKNVEIIAKGITEDAARAIAGKIDTSGIDKNEIVIVVFNNLPRKRNQVVTAEFDFAQKSNIQGFKLCEMDGTEINAQVISKSNCDAIFNHPYEVPCRMISDRWQVNFHADELPPMGYKVFRVIPQHGPYRHDGTMLTGAAAMENEFLQVQVNSNGSVNITSKETGMVLINQNTFQDRGAVGDYWVGAFPKQDKIVTSFGSQAEISVIEDGPLNCAIEVKTKLELPIAAAYDATSRLDQTKTVNITTVYKLNKSQRYLHITTTIENTVKDHIIRAMFPSDIQTDTAFAQTPFDVIERDIKLPDTRDWREPYKPVQPHLNFVDLTDGQKGVAILNKGLPQYEAVDDPQRTIALTLLRAHRAWNSVRLAHYPDQPGTQLQGTYTFEYAILPHKGNWEDGQVLYEAEKFNIAPVVGAAGPGKGDLPTELSFIELVGDGLVLNALKKGEWDDSIIIRISNPTSRNIAGSIKLHAPIAKAEIVNMMETETQQELTINENAICLNVPSKKVITVRILRK